MCGELLIFDTSQLFATHSLDGADCGSGGLGLCVCKSLFSGEIVFDLIQAGIYNLNADPTLGEFVA